MVEPVFPTTPAAGTIPYGNGTTLAYTAAGTSGQILQSNGTSAPSWATTDTTVWKIKGNTGLDSATAYLGTTDAKPIIFKTNATERMHISNIGNVGIGVANPVDKFHIYEDSASTKPMMIIQQNNASGDAAQKLSNYRWTKCYRRY